MIQDDCLGCHRSQFDSLGRPFKQQVATGMPFREAGIQSAAVRQAVML